MADKDATPEVDATEQEVGQGYKDDSEEVTEPSDVRIVEDVTQEFVSEREKAIEALVSKRNEDFEEEVGEVLASEEPEEIEEPKEVVKEESSPFWKDGESWYTTVKVDGEDIQVPFDDLKSSHQKDRASQKRFEEAAEYGRRVQAREAQLNQYIQQVRQNQQQPPPRGVAKKEEPKVDTELIKKYHEALYGDDADKAAELFTTLTNSGRRTPPATQNVEEVVEKVLTRTMAQQRARSEREQQWAYQKSLEDAVGWFDSEYPDVAAIPELRAVADSKTVTLTQENPDWTPKQIMEAAAESTRQWAKDSLSPDKNERVERKKKIVRHPRSASGSSKIGEDEPAPQTAGDIIKEMRESRGQTL
tara:strand:+ start:2720 stop:3799 length:1080 start_codon:yes stop_codon:yes gene_type:complete